MQNGAQLNGRALAQTAVTLINNNINEPVAPILPTVIATTPVNGATCVLNDSEVTATFSEPMDPTTINTGTFLLTQGATPVPGTVTYSGVTATFTPTNPLVSGATYTATITTEVTDVAGNHMVSNYAWCVKVCVYKDKCAPIVKIIYPSPCGFSCGSIKSSIMAAKWLAIDYGSGIANVEIRMDRGA